MHLDLSVERDGRKYLVQVGRKLPHKRRHGFDIYSIITLPVQFDIFSCMDMITLMYIYEQYPLLPFRTLSLHEVYRSVGDWLKDLAP